MQLKRRPTVTATDDSPAILEPWLDNSIRSFQRAKVEIRQHATETHVVRLWDWSEGTAPVQAGLRLAV